MKKYCMILAWVAKRRKNVLPKQLYLIITAFGFVFSMPMLALSSQSFTCPPRNGSYMWNQAIQIPTGGNGAVVFEALATNDIHVSFAEV